MTTPKRLRTALAAAAILLGAALLPVAVAAQDLFAFGDLEATAEEAVSSGDAGNAAFGGFDPASQYLLGRLALHLNTRLTFDSGELYVADTLTTLSTQTGVVLLNDLTQGYVSVTPLPPLTIVIGKRRLSWGSGYAFFPGDAIDPPSSPENRSEGFYGLTATLSPSASFTLTTAVRLDTAFPVLASLPGFAASPAAFDLSSLPFIAPYLPSAPANPWSAVRYAVYADLLLGNLDTYAAVTYQWQRVLRPAAGFSLDLGGIIANGEVAVELDNSSLYPNASGGFAGAAFGTPFPIATVGLQRSVSSDNGSFAITVEYLYNGLGYDQTQRERFYNDVGALLGAATPDSTVAAASLASNASGSAWFSTSDFVPSLGRNYGAVSISGSVTHLFSATAAVIVNMEDGSFAVQPELRYTGMSAIDLLARAVIAWGPSPRTEFGLLPLPVTIDVGSDVHF